VGELVVQGDERVLAPLSAAILVGDHVRIVPHRYRLGQLRVEIVRQTMLLAARTRIRQKTREVPGSHV
jgi:hypothetical protein